MTDHKSRQIRGKNRAWHYLVLILLTIALLMLPSCSKQDPEQQTLPLNRADASPYQETAQDCVMIMNNRLYASKVLILIERATEQIDVIMYQARFYAAHPDSLSNQLLYALARARNRGLTVRFLIESSDWNVENSLLNKRVADLLSAAGIEVKYDTPTQNSHNKLLLIDRKIVVIGSANWSYYSLERNNETSVAFRSQQAAQLYGDYFEDMFTAALKAYPLTYQETTADSSKNVQDSVMTLRSTIKQIRPSLFNEDSFALDLENSLTAVLPGTVAEEMFSMFPGFPGNVINRNVSLTVTVKKSDDHTTYEILTMDLLENEIRKNFLHQLAAKPLDMSSSDRTWKKCLPVSEFTGLNNETYLVKVIELIETAREIIRVIQIDCNYYAPGDRTGPPPATNKLLEALVAALNRGVDVEFLTEYKAGQSFSPRKQAFLETLRDHGAAVFLDHGEITTHSKLIVIDDHYLVVGSTNWSVPALTKNNESSLLLESGDVARVFTQFFDRHKEREY